jgi:hypothetical protein
VPGAGKGKDPYWTIENAWHHLVEVSQIFKWVHRKSSTNLGTAIDHCVQQLRYAALKQKGKLGLTGRTNWQRANNELPETPTVLAETPNNKPSTLTQKTSEDTLGVQELYSSQSMESDSNVGAFTDTDAWVECVTCSKWRLLPRGVDATSLPDDWTCSSGAAWRSNGLNCDITADEDEDQNKDDEVLADEGDSHQPMVGAFMVRRILVALLVEEEKWLRTEWGLRPCYTWKDGYSLYRCAAVNRRTSKQQMLSDLLQFWGYKWHTGTNDETGAAYEKKGYQYVYDFGRDNETVFRAQEFTEDVAQKNIEAVRLVQDTLIRGRVPVLIEGTTLPSNFWNPSWP